MNICKVCGTKIIRNDYFARHMMSHPEPAGVEPVVVEKAVEAPAPVIVAEPVSTEITLSFKRPVEISINGRKFEGMHVVTPDANVASEIIRIAREAYGEGII